MYEYFKTSAFCIIFSLGILPTFTFIHPQELKRSLEYSSSSSSKSKKKKVAEIDNEESIAKDFSNLKKLFLPERDKSPEFSKRFIKP